jgi:hypothetical protein
MFTHLPHTRAPRNDSFDKIHRPLPEHSIIRAQVLLPVPFHGLRFRSGKDCDTHRNPNHQRGGNSYDHPLPHVTDTIRLPSKFELHHLVGLSQSLLRVPGDHVRFSLPLLNGISVTEPRRLVLLRSREWLRKLHVMDRAVPNLDFKFPRIFRKRVRTILLFKRGNRDFSAVGVH